MNRLQRLMGMALLLSARRRLRATELAAHFGVSERTAYRDLRAIQQAGFPVSGTPGDGYRVAQSAFLRPLALDAREAEALAMAAQHLGAAADPPLQEALGSATAKLESVLEPDARRRLRAHYAEVLVPEKSRGEGGPLGLVLEALRARQVLQLAYQSVAGDRSQREVEPLGLVRMDEAWVMIAYCRLRDDVRAFRVNLIRRATHTGETFAPRPGHTFAEVVEREQRLRERRAGS